MKRVAILPILFVAGCPDEPVTPPGEMDASLPDAIVIGPRDAAPSDTGVVLPTVFSVSPSAGPETGGTRVTLRGTSFAEPAEVYFGDAPATSVVVLDEVSIAATTPPGAVGAVTVRVRIGEATAELPEGFFYHRELRIDAIEPARIPDEGGAEIAIIGKGFDEHTIVFFDRRPLRGLRLVSEERIVGHSPALEPGRPDVRVMNRDAEARRQDVAFVYGTPDIADVLPGYGPPAGSSDQEVGGDGLSDAEEVSFGGEAAKTFTLASDALVVADAPGMVEGIYDVTVSNADASGTLRNGYIVIDPTVPGLRLLGVLPARVREGSGAVVRVVGRGFGGAAQVAIDGQRLPIVERTSNALSVMVPVPLAAGAHDVTVFAGALEDTLAGGLVVTAPIVVTSIDPSTGPASGGTAVTIRGSGFVPGSTVRIADVALADVVVVGPSEITGVTVAGSHGTHDVVVAGGGDRGVLAAGFTFTEAYEIVRVEPNEGSVAGNTYVSVFGRGLVAPVGVKFGGVDGLDPVLENGAIIGVRTQPANVSVVDVDISTGLGDEILEDAFSFYNPRLITGGAWGGPIEGSVNVAVQTFQGQALQGMVVQLGYDADLRYAAITDENGLATISSPEIRGHQTVTVGAPGVEFVTYYEVDARNLTMFATPHPQSMPPDAPLSPCPTGAMPPLVRGKIFKFKSSLDPVTMPGWIPVARITYSQPNVFTPNPPMPPEQIDFVFQDGGEYEIVVMRAGTVAVYAILGDFNPETQQFIPRKMGIVRNVPAAPETTTEGIDIALEIDLNQTTRIRLDDPPIQDPGPSLNIVFPFLNLQSDGVIAFGNTVGATSEIVVTGLPNLPESQFFYLGGSATNGGGRLTPPWSLSFLETAVPFEQGVDLGPFLHMPQNPTPKPGELLHEGTMSWDQGGLVPDLTLINIFDVRTVGGCCCMDLNMNGQCEQTEPPQCGALPQQFDRWSLYAEGGHASYVLPRMPSGVTAFEAPNTYPWFVQSALAPRFSFREFIYNQFSPFFWKSWMAWGSSFAVKEETD